MTKKYLCLLAVVLGGCPAFEIPSSDAGLPENNGPNDGKQDQCFDGGVCEDDSEGPGAQGSNGGAGGSGAGGELSDQPRGDAGIPFDPGHPGGDLTAQFAQTLDALYAALCACEQVSWEECQASHESDRTCQLASIEANIDVAGPWLECASGALREQVDCLTKAGCDANLIIDCVSPDAEGQDPITARCGEAPSVIEQGDDACGEMSEDTGFPCFDGSGQVPAEVVCDGITHCIDGSDEMVCEPSGGDDSFECGDGERIDSDWECDGEVDCTNGSDEASCETVEPGPDPDPAISCGDGTGVPLSWVCDGYPDCANGSDELDCAEDA